MHLLHTEVNVKARGGSRQTFARGTELGAKSC